MYFKRGGIFVDALVLLGYLVQVEGRYLLNMDLDSEAFLAQKRLVLLLVFMTTLT